MARFPRFRPGDRFGDVGPDGRLRLSAQTAKLLTDAAKEIERLGKVWVQAPLTWSEDGNGRRLGVNLPPELDVILSGSGNPYSFQEAVFDTGSKTWSALTGGQTGNAYEANGVSGLGGKVVHIEYEVTSNDWRFQYIRIGCNPSTTTICTKITICSANNLAATGITITAVHNASGTSYGPCTATGQVVAVTRTSGGSGYTNGTGYALGIAGTGSGATGTFDVVSGVVTNLKLTARGSGYTTATISFPGAGSGTGAAATATLALACCIGVKKKGAYTVTATGPCGSGTAATTVSTCNTEADVTINLAGYGSLSFTNNAGVCGATASGTITITGPGGFTAGPFSFSGAGTSTLVSCLARTGNYTATFSGVTGNDPIPPQTVNVSDCSGGTFTVNQSGGTETAVVTVTRCGNPTGGMTVVVTSVSDPTYSFSGVTGDDGKCTVTGLHPGCTDYLVTASDEGCPGSVPKTVPLTTVTIDLAVHPDYVCCLADKNLPPLKKSLTVSGPLGTFAVLYQGNCIWSACGSIAGQPSTTYPGPGLYPDCGCPVTLTDHAIGLYLYVSIIDDTVIVSVYWGICGCFDTAYLMECECTQGETNHVVGLGSLSGITLTSGLGAASSDVQFLHRCPTNGSALVGPPVGGPGDLPGVYGTYFVTD